MVDDRESPSAGWREVYHEMEADTGIEEPTAPCPDCGRGCENVARDVYDCPEHGLFRASGGDSGASAESSGASDAAASDASESSGSAGADAGGESDPPNADDVPEPDDETTNRTRWSAGPV